MPMDSLKSVQRLKLTTKVMIHTWPFNEDYDLQNRFTKILKNNDHYKVQYTQK